MINVKNLGICFRKKLWFTNPKDGFWALRNVSFQVDPGHVVAVMGRNGSGKTTLLRAVAGIFSPDEGTIDLRSEKITLQALRAGFKPDLSGRANILTNALLMGMSYREAKKQTNSIIEMSELAEFIDDPVRTYSSGMQARLGFSIAMHVEPEIMLIDETLSVGDPGFKEQAKALIRERIRDTGRTVLIATHDQKLISGFCDTALVLERGTLTMNGDPEEILKEWRLKSGPLRKKRGNAKNPQNGSKDPETAERK